MGTLEQKKQAALNQLMAIGTARRGQLSEQYYERKAADGTVRRTGPYYVWQRWVDGRKQSVRVPAEAIAQVKADLARGRQVQELFDELFASMEQSAIRGDADSKKKRGRSKRPKAGKSRSS
jgi:hypothetical protein